jgi:hypothetical protein
LIKNCGDFCLQCWSSQAVQNLFAVKTAFLRIKIESKQFSFQEWECFSQQM